MAGKNRKDQPAKAFAGGTICSFGTRGDGPKVGQMYQPITSYGIGDVKSRIM